eukprot:SAG22_NODE_9372_length_592_cov_10.478702_1_plen_74_part_00
MSDQNMKKLKEENEKLKEENERLEGMIDEQFLGLFGILDDFGYCCTSEGQIVRGVKATDPLTSPFHRDGVGPD